MHLGDLEFQILTDGTIGLDGGAMFGVIPKPLWEKVAPADARNRIRLAMNCLLIRAAGKLILVETGAGDKWTAKESDIYDLHDPHRLPQSLSGAGVRPEDIDFVVNTHLHFDHCGWNTRREGDRIVPTFPNARYVVQRGAYEHGKAPTERDRGSFRDETFVPIDATGQWQLLDGDTELVPGVDLIRIQGHTPDMQCVRLSGGGRSALFLADLIPTTAHLPLAWIMGFDLFPLTTLELKKYWIPKLAREGTLALFAHDTATPAAWLREDGDKFGAEPADVD
jgi:glyoxylase-like metal-dependent hydrolase (beta-lactamase superfamily II)